jgi:hypothetical protein
MECIFSIRGMAQVSDFRYVCLPLHSGCRWIHCTLSSDYLNAGRILRLYHLQLLDLCWFPFENLKADGLTLREVLLACGYISGFPELH